MNLEAIVCSIQENMKPISLTFISLKHDLLSYVLTKHFVFPYIREYHPWLIPDIKGKASLILSVMFAMGFHLCAFILLTQLLF